MSARRRPWARVHLALLLCACGEDAAPPSEDSAPQDDGAPDTDTDTEGEPGDAQPGADACAIAAPTGAGVFRGDLRGKDSSNGGACGLGGPDVFFHIDVDFRADVSFQGRAGAFEPRIGVRHSDCATSFADAGVLCTSGVPGWVTDVAAGTRLIASVGIDADDPALNTAESLPFELEVVLRPVLAAGERCEPESVGRCETGTQCTAEVDAFGGSLGPATCVELEGDTCQSALPLLLRRGTTQLGIPRDARHSDAHEHSCTGARTRERVFAVRLHGEPGPDARLEIGTPPDLGVAVRGPGCLPQEELQREGDGAAACVSGPGTLVVSSPPSRFFLFVELPAEDPAAGEEAPYELSVLFEPG